MVPKDARPGPGPVAGFSHVVQDPSQFSGRKIGGERQAGDLPGQFSVAGTFQFGHDAV